MMRRAGETGLPASSALTPPHEAYRTNRFMVALLAVAVATALKLVVQPLARGDEASLGFFAAVMFAAWYGGLAPGLVATAASAIVSDYLFLRPLYTFPLHAASDWTRLIQFLAEGSLISAMGGSLRRALGSCGCGQAAG